MGALAIFVAQILRPTYSTSSRLAPTRRSRSGTGTKQDRSTLRVVDGSQSRGYSLFAADTAASTAVQLMHRKRFMMRGAALFTGGWETIIIQAATR